jgi:hypothetical protein
LRVVGLEQAGDFTNYTPTHRKAAKGYLPSGLDRIHLAR